MRRGLRASQVGGCIVVFCLAFGGCSERPTTAPKSSTEDTLVEVCSKCGEIKGSDECCKLEGKTLCPKCGLIKGSPGCCKLPKDKSTPVYICPKCGEIKGSDECCKLEGKTICPKCGLIKGSPGCCKLPKKD